MALLVVLVNVSVFFSFVFFDKGRWEAVSLDQSPLAGRSEHLVLFFDLGVGRLEAVLPSVVGTGIVGRDRCHRWLRLEIAIIHCLAHQCVACDARLF